MEYTTKKLAQLAGVSSRTLRYYDEIGLLKPCRINSSGYRIYGEKEINLLQQILFYRELDMKLEEISAILSGADFEIDTALNQHYQRLIARRNQLDQLISTVEKTISSNKGEYIMTDKEKFDGFKKEKLSENEKKYGKEIREKYGEATVEASNKMFGNMTEEDFAKMQQIEKDLFQALKEVEELLKTGGTSLDKALESQAAQRVYEKHRAWLGFTWPDYSAEAHRGLAEMYVADERFAKYYNDRSESQVVTLLRDIIVKYAV